MPKSTPKNSLKQATLSFSASKRTASNTSAKKGAAKLAISRVVVDSDSDDIDGIDVDSIDLSSDDEVEDIDPDDFVEEKPATPVAKQQHSVVKVTRPREKAVAPVVELNGKDPRWRKQWNAAKATRDYLQLIHAEDQDKFHDILRVFDLSYEYGPCIGVTRLERWERASALGLNPPTEVRDILTTRQGAHDSYSQSVFYNQD